MAQLFNINPNQLFQAGKVNETTVTQHEIYSIKDLNSNCKIIPTSNKLVIVAIP